MTDFVCLDIETIPSQEAWVAQFAEKYVKPPGTLKKQESIDKWIAEEREGAIQDSIDKMGFDGSTNHIICIGVSINDQDPVSFSAETVDQEAGALKAFYSYISDLDRPQVVGHNIAGFDLKIIRQRSIVLGIPLPANLPFFAKPWEFNPYDTMVQWDPRNNIKLDRLAQAFGIPGKDGMDGSKVYGAWKEGRHQEIAEYCRADVEMTRAVFKRMTGRV